MDDDLKTYLEAMEGRIIAGILAMDVRMMAEIITMEIRIMTKINDGHERILNRLSSIERDFMNTKELNRQVHLYRAAVAGSLG